MLMTGRGVSLVVIVVGKTSGGDPLNAGVKSLRLVVELLRAPKDGLPVLNVEVNPVKTGGATQVDS